MKIIMAAALVLAALPLAGCAQQRADNYLTYSYREHYRAYGVNSLRDGSLPPDEVYPDSCYRWVSTRRGMRKVFVCRS